MKSYSTIRKDSNFIAECPVVWTPELPTLSDEYIDFFYDTKAKDAVLTGESEILFGYRCDDLEISEPMEHIRDGVFYLQIPVSKFAKELKH